MNRRVNRVTTLPGLSWTCVHSGQLNNSWTDLGIYNCLFLKVLSNENVPKYRSKISYNGKKMDRLYKQQSTYYRLPLKKQKNLVGGNTYYCLFLLWPKLVLKAEMFSCFSSSFFVCFFVYKRNWIWVGVTDDFLCLFLCLVHTSLLGGYLYSMYPSAVIYTFHSIIHACLHYVPSDVGDSLYVVLSLSGMWRSWPF